MLLLCPSPFTIAIAIEDDEDDCAQTTVVRRKNLYITASEREYALIDGS